MQKAGRPLFVAKTSDLISLGRIRKSPRRSTNFSNNNFGTAFASKKALFEFDVSMQLSQVDTRAPGKRIADSLVARIGGSPVLRGTIVGEMRK